MKKLLLFLTVTPTLLLGCGKEEPEITDNNTNMEDPMLQDNLDDAMQALEELEELGIK